MIYYCLLVLIPYFIDIKEEMTQRRHLIEKGYDYAVPPFFLETVFKEVKRYAGYLIPIVNIFNLVSLFIDKYERFNKNDIKKMLENGEIVPVQKVTLQDEEKELLKILSSRKSNMSFKTAELTKEALIDQAYVIKQINRNEANDLTETWRDFSTDRKIEILLGELEALYHDKALEMGFDLDKELDSIDNPQIIYSEKKSKKLKK